MQKCNQSYGLKAVAGFDGFNNLVEWVHIMESSNVGAFFKRAGAGIYYRCYE